LSGNAIAEPFIDFMIPWLEGSPIPKPPPTAHCPAPCSGTCRTTKQAGQQQVIHTTGVGDADGNKAKVKKKNELKIQKQEIVGVEWKLQGRARQTGSPL